MVVLPTQKFWNFLGYVMVRFSEEGVTKCQLEVVRNDTSDTFEAVGDELSGSGQT